MKLIENTPENIEKIATAFVAELRKWLSPEEFEKMCADNRRYLNEGLQNVCASADLCDSNMAMDAAFHDCFARSPLLPCDVESGAHTDDDVAHEVDIWNAAWDLAKARDLTIPLWKYEFSDYPADEMPATPTDWKDKSWHNDTCPFFISPNHLGVFIDYADPEKREIPSPRFSVVLMDAQDMHLVTEPNALLASDDWQSVLDFVSTYSPPTNE